MSVGPSLGTAIAGLPYPTDAELLTTTDPFCLVAITPIESETFDAAMAAFSSTLDQRLQDLEADLQVGVRQQAIVSALIFGDVR